MRRGGFTLVELMMASGLVCLFICMAYSFFFSGRRTLESTSRKVDAIRLTHLRFEEIRHDLETSEWAWAPSPPDEDEGGGKIKLGGGHQLTTSQNDYVYLPERQLLLVNGGARSGKFKDVRFYGRRACTIKFCISCDKFRKPATKRPPFRECSTLVSKVFLETQYEEIRERNHVSDLHVHAFCIGGPPIHYGFDD